MHYARGGAFGEMKKNAYFTVEAALVFPLVLGALLLTVFLLVFQYDRCLMEQDMGLLALYARELDTEDEEKTVALLNRRATEIYRDQYVAWEQEKLQITMEKNEIKIVGEGTMTFPVPEWNFYNGNNMWRAKRICVAMRLDPVDFIRIFRRVEGGE